MRHLLSLVVLGGCASLPVDTTDTNDTNDTNDANDTNDQGPDIWNVIFQPGIGMSACLDGLQWSSQNVSADDQGHFDETWAPNEPNTARIEGDVTATAFTATLSCFPSGTPSGTLAAAPVGVDYEGTYSFDGQDGAISVSAVY